MDFKTEKILAVIGASMGILGTIVMTFLWLLVWGGLYDAWLNVNVPIDVISAAGLAFGLKCSIIQAIVSLTFFILTLVNSIKSKPNCVVLLVSGITVLVLNIALMFPAVLLIFAGGMTLSKNNNNIILLNNSEIQ